MTQSRAFFAVSRKIHTHDDARTMGAMMPVLALPRTRSGHLATRPRTA